MKTISAINTTSHFGDYFSAALSGPVAIQKTARQSVVMLSQDVYDQLDVSSEDSYWVAKTELAEKSGYVGEAKGKEIVGRLLNVKA